ncbi:TetR/AcrR family transcriptional regulator [Lentilactobacillus sp. SPB1-3]|uniref:TetR/AcrR family transcriptional regulator n=1 Tax=Lentilactobacillus terminaliae TaxID=3003483 RepID=A0ACD5DE90_9LACO|nr:TetR/AcrR family transcriptional regulator [Lentilactobacillus sp. SPB1-3]MCZ0977711.1 TetR/AcrR family transcriptional regulator [Lentilactobacillus sp. SPB1-3]
MKINNVETLFDSSISESELSVKQQEVLKASLTLFAQQGFESTTSSQIAELAGVSEGTVFKKFKTKQGILEALLRPFIENVIPRAMNEFESEVATNEYSDFESFLHYIVKDRMQFALDSNKQLKVFIQEIIRNPEIFKLIAVKWDELIAGRIGQVINRFKEKGQIGDISIDQVMQYTASIVLSYMIPRIISNVDIPFDVEQKSLEATKFLMNGLRNHD